ncbi:MAG: RSP_7527 family protein [Saccharospirillum sp.]
MKESTQSSNPKIVTDIWGNVDIAYYESQAMKMRNEYFQAALTNFGKRIKDSLSDLFSGTQHTRDA